MAGGMRRPFARPSFRAQLAANVRAQELYYTGEKGAERLAEAMAALPGPAKARARKRSSSPTELQEQIAVCNWWFTASKTYKLPVFALFAIPNGGGRGVIESANFKRSGVRPGIPDLFLAVPKDTRCGLFIEMKAAKGRESAEQVVVRRFLFKSYDSVVCWSAAEAITAIEDYLGPPF